MEPPWIQRWGNLEEEADEDADERFLSHGMREVPSTLALAAQEDEAGLGKEDDPGLGLQEAQGLG